MTKTNFDVYLEKQLSDPDFEQRYQRAGGAWEGVGTTQQEISRLEFPEYEGHSLQMPRMVAKDLLDAIRQHSRNNR